ncbi:radial spokehead family protein [Cardiosporidium cionae]|uniref:Radial spokehead family protein n=1 Tax=Cardiosporidium cionae TaxID=476202 RepID=A0ABQ7J5E8_9APIC|nr:radial spokehead family protein [Cardiosporidium cionae]|eukprot:KAF8819183.1 radial spokehead family protein [Cardiosporidium cionae]
MSSEDIDFEKAKSYLQQSSDGKNNLYDHLVRLLSQIFLETPENPFKCFEALSHRLKEFSSSKVGTINAGKDITPYQEASPREITNWFASLSDLITKQEQAVTCESISHPFWQQNSLLEHAGIAIKDDDASLVTEALHNLANSVPSCTHLRLWGIISGIENDYYIAEGKQGVGKTNVESEGENEPKRNFSDRVLNKFSYWVIDSLSLPRWIMLPDLTITQALAACKIKKLLTGHLDRPIYSYPQFPGTEKNLLRAIITLISIDTIVCPAGWWSAGFEDESITDLAADLEDYQHIQNWTYVRDPIRPSVEIDGIGTESESSVEIRYGGSVASSDSLSTDRNLRLLSSSNIPCWAIRLAGDRSKYGKERKCNVAIILRNLKWQGAVCVYQDAQLINFYRGFGIKLDSSSHFPVAPPPVQDEVADLDEQPEPHPQEDNFDDDRPYFSETID